MGNLINNYSNTAIYMQYDVNSRVIGNTILTKTKANNIEAIFAEYDPSNDIVSKNTIIGNNSLYSEAICYDSSSNFRIFNNTIVSKVPVELSKVLPVNVPNESSPLR